MEEIEEIRCLKEQILVCENKIEELKQETIKVNKDYKRLEILKKFLMGFSDSRSNAFDKLEILKSNIFSTLNSARSTLESCTDQLQFFHNLKVSYIARPNLLKSEAVAKTKNLAVINEGIVSLQNEIKSVQEKNYSVERDENYLKNECLELENQKNKKNKILNEILPKIEMLRKNLEEKNSHLASFPELKLNENEKIVKIKKNKIVKNPANIYSNQSSEAETEDSVTKFESKFYTIRDKSDDLTKQKSLLLIDQARMRNEIRILQNLNYNKKVVGNFNSKQESQLLLKYFALSLIICFSLLYLY